MSAGTAGAAGSVGSAGSAGSAGFAGSAGSAGFAGSAGQARAPRQFAAAWGGRGEISHLDGPVHWVEFGAVEPAGAVEPVAYVHGLGGSHLNWTLTAGRLAPGRRVVALDLHGFGLTPGTRRTATVARNGVLLDRFVREVAGQPAILVGNSMGGLLAIAHAHAHPATVAGLVLIAPALPPPVRRPDLHVASRFLLYAMPGLGELYMTGVRSRLTPRQAVQGVIELCFADPARADPAMLEATIALAELRRSMPGGDESFLAAARSLMRVIGQPRRYWAMMAALTVPVLLIGGTADRLVPAASIREAAARNPGWDTVLLDGAGHTPQLEVPDVVTGTVRAWLDRHFTRPAR